jgi:hypothetical protein
MARCQCTASSATQSQPQFTEDMQQRLNFLPLPQGQGRLRPSRTGDERPSDGPPPGPACLGDRPPNSGRGVSFQTFMRTGKKRSTAPFVGGCPITASMTASATTPGWSAVATNSQTSAADRRLPSRSRLRSSNVMRSSPVGTFGSGTERRLTRQPQPREPELPAHWPTGSLPIRRSGTRPGCNCCRKPG